MARPSEKTVDRAYDFLRDQLVAFQVKPGVRLNESELAGQLSMSRAPLREALNRLTADGLVVFKPGSGFYCRKLSAREITELFAVRRDLELGALRDTIDGTDKRVLERFADDRLSAFGGDAGPGVDDLVTADERFHLDLAALAGNDQRLRILRNINDRIRFVRRINLETMPRKSDSLAEHLSLLEALAARDGALALNMLDQHISRTVEEVRLQVQNAMTYIYADEVA